jgi:hypothetical protein
MIQTIKRTTTDHCLFENLLFHPIFVIAYHEFILRTVGVLYNGVVTRSPVLRWTCRYEEARCVTDANGAAFLVQGLSRHCICLRWASWRSMTFTQYQLLGLRPSTQQPACTR